MSPSSIAKPNTRSPVRLWRKAVRWAFLSLGVAWFVLRIPAEISYWNLAQAEISAERSDNDTALRWAENAQWWNPHFDRCALTTAAIYRNQGDFDSALKVIDTALARHDTEMLRHSRFDLLLEAGREQEVLEVVRQLPGDADSLQRQLEVAVLFERRGQFPAAIRLLDSVPLNDRTATYFLVRSEILSKTKRYADALQAFDEAAKLQPSAVNKFSRLELLCHLKRFDDVAQACNTLESEASTWTVWTDASLANSLAYFRAVASRDLDKALVQAQRAVTISLGADPSVLDTRGFVLWRLGKWSEAAADLAKAVTLMETQRRSLQPRPGQPSLLEPRHVKNSVQQRSDQVLAVILYHRSLVEDSQQDETAAQADRERVSELGFTPDDDFF